jgi:UDP-glucose:(heptosyl)LPS alpha-1,3-glucosyltransferase
VRIGLVIEHFDPRRGGAEWWTYQHAENLLREGFEVHVVAQDISTNLPIVPHRLGRIGSPLERAEAAEQALIPLGLDIVHDMGLGWHGDFFQPHGGCWTAVCRKKMRLVPAWLRPWKRAVDAWLPRHRRHDRLIERQCAAGSILLALSRKIADEFREYHDFPSERIRVVYNGVDVKRFSPENREEFRGATRRQLGLAEDRVVALAVAHNFVLKGVPTILEAMARLLPERLPLHVVVVGGSNVERWRRRAAARGLGECISFVGSRSDILPFYAAADILVHPTFYDSCSLVLLEAAACGLASISSRENGAAELFADGVEALKLDDPADSRMLADQLRSLLDKSLRKSMGAAARKLALRHTLEHNFAEILELYRQKANKSRAA